MKQSQKQQPEKDMLELMFHDMEQASAMYQPTHFWRQGIEAIRNEIQINGPARFRSLPEALRFFVPLYGSRQSTKQDASTEKNLELGTEGTGNRKTALALEQFLCGELQAFSDYRVFAASLQNCHPFLDQVSESSLGEPVEQFTFEGRRYSRSLLNYLLGLSFLKQHGDLSTVQTVLEIGGGFGSLGEILLGDKRNHCFYLDVDIPPTAYLASYYLQGIFGSKAIGTYDELHKESPLTVADLRNRYKGAVLCPWQLPKLTGTIDLFVNFISFQEMEPEVVKNYLRQVDRLQARFILLRNLREGKQKADDRNPLGVREPVKGEDYDGFLSNYRLLATNTVPYGYKTVDGFHSELRAYQRIA